MRTPSKAPADFASLAAVEVIRLDVAERESIVTALGAVDARLGPVDVLANVPGYGQRGSLEEVTLDQIRTHVVLMPECPPPSPCAGHRTADQGPLIRQKDPGMARTTPQQARAQRSPESHRSRLGSERTTELYTAVVDLLHKIGYDALTMEAVTARVHCSKAALYRRFSSKQELVTESLRCLSPLEVAVFDTGSLAGDLHALIEGRDGDRLRDDAALLRGLLRALHAHPELASALRKPGPGQLDALITRAVDRGELPSVHPASGYLPYLLLGALITRSLVEGVLADRTFLHHFVDAVILPALGVAGPRQDQEAGSDGHVEVGRAGEAAG
jgi:AcrR family transcriptional regulator